MWVRMGRTSDGGEPSERVCEALCVGETPRVGAPACVGSVVCVYEARRVSERPCMRVTACVRSLCEREMTVAMHEHAAVSPGVSLNGSVMECSLGVVTQVCVGGMELERENATETTATDE